MRAPRRETWVAVAGQRVMLALDDELGVRERVVITGVVDIEMRADEDVDVSRAEIQIGEMFEDIFFVGGGGRGGVRGVGSHPGVDQDALVVSGLDEIAGGTHFQGLACWERYGRSA